MTGMLMTTCVALALVQRGAAPAAQAQDPVRSLVSRLDLERYKTTLKGLAQFGDRRQGTERNRKAVDWIEAQLKSYGCTNTERIQYTYPPESAQRGQTPSGRLSRQGGRGTAGTTNQGGEQHGQAARGQGGVGRSAKVIDS